MSQKVHPYEIAEVLCQHEILIINWQRFAGLLGLGNPEIIRLKNPKIETPENRIEQLLHMSESRETLTVGKAISVLMDMNCLGVADGLRIYEEDTIITRNAPMVSRWKGQQAEDRFKSVEKSSLECKEKDWPYTVDDVLGAGYFGIVLRVSRNVGSSRSFDAMKIIPLSTTNRHEEVIDYKSAFRSKLSREVDNQERLSKCQHDNVVKYKSAKYFRFSKANFERILELKNIKKYKTEEIAESNAMRKLLSILYNADDNHLITGIYIVTEECGESLRRWLHVSDLCNVTPLEVCQSVTEGLKYIHDQGIIHRDLRPDNVYFSKRGFLRPIKIGDFGSSLMIESAEQGAKKTSTGFNSTYCAPEIFSGNYGQEVDLFSLGILMFEVYDKNQEPNQQQARLQTLRYKRITGENFDQRHPEISNLVIRLTEPEPQKRYHLNGVLEHFRHKSAPEASTNLKGTFGDQGLKVATIEPFAESRQPEYQTKQRYFGNPSAERQPEYWTPQRQQEIPATQRPHEFFAAQRHPEYDVIQQRTEYPVNSIQPTGAPNAFGFQTFTAPIEVSRPSSVKSGQGEDQDKQLFKPWTHTMPYQGFGNRSQQHVSIYAVEIGPEHFQVMSYNSPLMQFETMMRRQPSRFSLPVEGEMIFGTQGKYSIFDLLDPPTDPIRVDTNVGQQLVPLVEVLGAFFGKISRVVQDTLRQGRDWSIIAVIPIRFTIIQRQYLEAGAKRAGFSSLTIVNDTTAAALCFAEECEPGTYEVTVGITPPTNGSLFQFARYKITNSNTPGFAHQGSKAQRLKVTMMENSIRNLFLLPAETAHHTGARADALRKWLGQNGWKDMEVLTSSTLNSRIFLMVGNWSGFSELQGMIKSLYGESQAKTVSSDSAIQGAAIYASKISLYKKVVHDISVFGFVVNRNCFRVHVSCAPVTDTHLRLGVPDRSGNVKFHIVQASGGGQRDVPLVEIEVQTEGGHEVFARITLTQSGLMKWTADSVYRLSEGQKISLRHWIKLRVL